MPEGTHSTRTPVTHSFRVTPRRHGTGTRCLGRRRQFASPERRDRVGPRRPCTRISNRARRGSAKAAAASSSDHREALRRKCRRGLPLERAMALSCAACLPNRRAQLATERSDRWPPRVGRTAAPVPRDRQFLVPIPATEHQCRPRRHPAVLSIGMRQELAGPTRLRMVILVTADGLRLRLTRGIRAPTQSLELALFLARIRRTAAAPPRCRVQA